MELPCSGTVEERSALMLAVRVLQMDLLRENWMQKSQKVWSKLEPEVVLASVWDWEFA